LTAAGLALLDQIMPDYYRRVADLGRALTVAERQGAANLLDRLAAALPAFNQKEHP
jgi:hypothetical protein